MGSMCVAVGQQNVGARWTPLWIGLQIAVVGLRCGGVGMKCFTPVPSRRILQ